MESHCSILNCPPPVLYSVGIENHTMCGFHGRPKLPLNIEPILIALVMDCWNADTAKRPTMPQVRDSLNNLCGTVCSRKRESFYCTFLYGCVILQYVRTACVFLWKQNCVSIVNRICPTQKIFFCSQYQSMISIRSASTKWVTDFTKSTHGTMRINGSKHTLNHVKLLHLFTGNNTTQMAQKNARIPSRNISK